MRALLFSLLLGSLAACEDPAPAKLAALTQAPLDEALLSIGGRSSKDVWAVGADKGKGPIVLHYDGLAWTRMATGTQGTLWWVQAFDDGTVYAAGAGATILRWDGQSWTRMTTPGLASYTVFGVWGRSPSDAYAVGSVSGRDGFVWHYDGSAWSNVEVPDDLPGDTDEAPGFFKVCGNRDDVFVVGAHGNVLRSSRGGPFAPLASGTTATLYTVAASDSLVIAVGGSTSGALLEGTPEGTLAAATPEQAGVLQGVSLLADGRALASGADGALYERKAGRWSALPSAGIDVQSLHASWLDPDGGVWAVGGNVLDASLTGGVLVHRGAEAAYVPPPTTPPPVAAVCPDDQIDPAPDRSIARRWNEQILGAIRRAVPRPGVHARNLYHLSAAMWDAWASYDPVADGVFFRERHTAADVEAARSEAISYAAYRVLSYRYPKEAGGAVSTACFDAFLRKLGYDPTDETLDGDSARAIGNRVGAAVIAAGVADGANEANDYADTTGWKSTNPPLVVDQPGTTLPDPDHWQPLNLAAAETQNGIVLASGVQGYVCSNWDQVTPFAMARPSADAPYHDPGPAPRFAEPAMKDWLVEVIRREAALDPSDGASLDISPGAYGNNSLGANDGSGRALNPVTGLPYAAQVVARGDFGRVLAEFWADGPKSETPPGHWNVIANQVSDTPGFSHQLGGTGASLAPLAWDVAIYLALNGAVHDAAITSWGIKRRSTTVRPISAIRHMAALGQSSDPTLPRYDPNGLPLVDGLIELITPQSAAAGQRHAHLRRHVGELALRAWRGEPGDRKHELAGVAWIRAAEWSPYQRRTFVTPAFPGFTSGHSTFSRAAAEVLATMTGSPYFPGGLGEHVAAPGSLQFERGPDAEIRLQWATYYDAADQAGQSRLWGGIHITPDDLAGRRTGSAVGVDAAALARKYLDGSAAP
jgi:hypothetical protein